MNKFQKLMLLIAFFFFIPAWLTRNMALAIVGFCYIALSTQKGFKK